MLYGKRDLDKASNGNTSIIDNYSQMSSVIDRRMVLVPISGKTWLFSRR